MSIVSGVATNVAHRSFVWLHVCLSMRGTCRPYSFFRKKGRFAGVLPLPSFFCVHISIYPLFFLRISVLEVCVLFGGMGFTGEWIGVP